MGNSSMILRFLGKSLFGACVVVWLMVVLCSTAQPAYAYVDPGSGVLLLQIIGSTFAGITFLLRKRVRQFFERFGRSSTKEGDDFAHR
jgi:hypothetical protein